MDHAVIVHSGRARDWYWPLVDEVLSNHRRVPCRQGMGLESPHSLAVVVGSATSVIEALADVDLPHRGDSDSRVTFSVLYALRRLLGYHDTVLFDKYPILARYTRPQFRPYYPRLNAYFLVEMPDDEGDMPYLYRAAIAGREVVFVDQLRRTVHLLASPSSRTSRRALVDFGEGYNARCVMSWLFLVRDESLRLYQHMRSNDLVVGMPNDLVDARVAQCVLASITGTSVGELHHQASIIQIYERDIAGMDCLKILRKLSRANENREETANRLRNVPILIELNAALEADMDRSHDSLDQGADRYYRIMSRLEKIFWAYNRECSDQNRACVAHLLNRYESFPVCSDDSSLLA